MQSQRSFVRNIYALDFLLFFHLFLVLYVNSSILSNYFSAQAVSSVFFVGSFFALLAITFLPRLLRIHGLIKVMLTLSVIETALFVGLGTTSSGVLLVIFFIATQMTYITLTYGLDILLERAISKEGSTGHVRGIFLTIVNTALILCPLLVGYLVERHDYSFVYILSSLIMIPVALIMGFGFRGFSDPKYHSYSIVDTYKKVFQVDALRKVYFAHFVLRIFYGFMVIYSPLFLRFELGFSWSEIGILLSLAILPFVLFEYSIGKIADSYIGEKEMMVLGYIIMIVAVSVFFFATTKSLVFWGILFFISRTGASLVEVTTESYFFKHVDAYDASLISVFRALHPLSGMIAPLIAGMVLLVAGLQYVFLALVVILVFGLALSLTLTDTR